MGKNNMGNSKISTFLKDDPVVLPSGIEATVIQQRKDRKVLVRLEGEGGTHEVKLFAPESLKILWDKMKGEDGWSPYSDFNEHLTGTTSNKDIFGSNPKKKYNAKGFSFNSCQHYMHEFKLNEDSSVYLTAVRGKNLAKGIEPPTMACYLDTGWLDQAKLWFTGDAPSDEDLYDPSKTPTLWINWKDMSVIPLRELSQAVVWCLRRVKEGERLSIGCHGAHGRTGTLLACLLVHEGTTATEAISRVRKDYCNRAIETKGQEDLIVKYDNALNEQTETGND